MLKSIMVIFGTETTEDRRDSVEAYIYSKYHNHPNRPGSDPTPSQAAQDGQFAAQAVDTVVWWNGDTYNRDDAGNATSVKVI